MSQWTATDSAVSARLKTVLESALEVVTGITSGTGLKRNARDVHYGVVKDAIPAGLAKLRFRLKWEIVFVNRNLYRNQRSRYGQQWFNILKPIISID